MKKSRVDRGLDDLYIDNFNEVVKTDDKTEEQQGNICEVSISLVEPNKGQPRTKFDDDNLAELAESIKENGILQPILVRPIANGGYQIIAGERRWRAARLAGLKEVPVYIRELTDRQTMQVALIENIQRQDLTPLEEAKAYRQLMDTYGMTQLELSQVVGKSRSVIANSLRLLTLSEPVGQMVEDGKLSAGHAKMLAGIEDTDIQMKCAEECVDKGFSVRQLEGYISQVIKESSNKGKDLVKKNSFKHADPFLQEYILAVDGNSNIKTKVRINPKGTLLMTLDVPNDERIREFLSRLSDLLSDF